MTIEFSGLDPSQAFLYMDDLIVIGCSKKHMLKNLSDVFEKCRKYNRSYILKKAPVYA